MNKFFCFLIVGLFSFMLIGCGENKEKIIVVNEEPYIFVDYSLYPGEEKLFLSPCSDTLDVLQGKAAPTIKVQFDSVIGTNLECVSFRTSIPQGRDLRVKCKKKIEEPVKINQLKYKGTDEKNTFYLITVDITISNNDSHKDSEPQFPTYDFYSIRTSPYWCYQKGFLALYLNGQSLGLSTFTKENFKFLGFKFRNEAFIAKEILGYNADDGEWFNDVYLKSIEEVEVDYQRGYWVAIKFDLELPVSYSRVFTDVLLKLSFLEKDTRSVDAYFINRR